MKRQKNKDKVTVPAEMPPRTQGLIVAKPPRETSANTAHTLPSLPPTPQPVFVPQPGSCVPNVIGNRPNTTQKSVYGVQNQKDKISHTPETL